MNENGPWTIGELSELVLRVLHSSGLLEADYAGQPNGRVSAIPQQRTIRWYASIGLLDKPLTMRGRTALYGRRHLCQLVAIKRLQAQGRSVAQVQEDLLGATDATLEGIAHLPSELLDATWEYDFATGRDQFTLSRRPRFWAGGEDDADSVRRGGTFETVARAARIVGDDADDDTVTFEEGTHGDAESGRAAVTGEGPSGVGAGSEAGPGSAAERERGSVAEAGQSAAGPGSRAESEHAPAAEPERWAGPGQAVAAARPARGAAGSGGERGADGGPAVAAEGEVVGTQTRGGRGAAAEDGAKRRARDARGGAAEEDAGRRGPVRRGVATAAAGVAAGTGRGTRAARGAAAEGAEGIAMVPAVWLGGGVTLLLGAATRPLNAEDLARLEQAAGPLLELLRRLGLDGPDAGRDTR